MRSPQVVREASLPERVTIYEVGPRDGLQNEQAVVPVETKASFVRRLVEAGLPIVEATSFVHPKWVPQLADAADLLDLLIADLGDTAREMPVLVPNERGLDRALEKGSRHIAIFGSATETFARRNLNRSVAESVEMFAPVVARARAEGLWVFPSAVNPLHYYYIPSTARLVLDGNGDPAFSFLRYVINRASQAEAAFPSCSMARARLTARLSGSLTM